MTDRYTGFIVTLEHDMREDDAESTIEAIRHIKGVVGVEPVKTDMLAEFSEKTRIRQAFWDQMRKVDEEIFK